MATRYIFPSPIADGSIMLELLQFISYLLTLYVYILIAAAVMSWLVVFNVVNPRNQFVHMIGEFLYRVTEPVLRPIRDLLPNLGGIDVSPIVVILVIVCIQNVILPVLARAIA
jgi:YggT family protein